MLLDRTGGIAVLIFFGPSLEHFFGKLRACCSILQKDGLFIFDDRELCALQFRCSSLFGVLEGDGIVNFVANFGTGL